MQNKTLTFTSQGLRERVRFFLIFDNPADDLYNNKLPVVWRAQKFGPGAEEPEPLTVTFSNQLAWFTHTMRSHIDIDRISDATPVTYDRRTTLQQGGLPFIPSETDTMTLVNGRDGVQNVALGFISPPVGQGQPTPVPVYHWSLGAAQTIHTNFKPVLRAYVYADGPPNYRQKLIVGAVIAGGAGQPVFTEDLTDLPANTNWVITTNAAGGFVINRV